MCIVERLHKCYYNTVYVLIHTKLYTYISCLKTSMCAMQLQLTECVCTYNTVISNDAKNDSYIK